MVISQRSPRTRKIETRNTAQHCAKIGFGATPEPRVFFHHQVGAGTNIGLLYMFPSHIIAETNIGSLPDPSRVPSIYTVWPLGLLVQTVKAQDKTPHTLLCAYKARTVMLPSSQQKKQDMYCMCCVRSKEPNRQLKRTEFSFYYEGLRLGFLHRSLTTMSSNAVTRSEWIPKGGAALYRHPWKTAQAKQAIRRSECSRRGRGTRDEVEGAGKIGQQDVIKGGRLGLTPVCRRNTISMVLLIFSFASLRGRGKAAPTPITLTLTRDHRGRRGRLPGSISRITPACVLCIDARVT